jgi:hypothetical protein
VEASGLSVYDSKEREFLSCHKQNPAKGGAMGTVPLLPLIIVHTLFKVNEHRQAVPSAIYTGVVIPLALPDILKCRRNHPQKHFRRSTTKSDFPGTFSLAGTKLLHFLRDFK